MVKTDSSPFLLCLYLNLLTDKILSGRVHCFAISNVTSAASDVRGKRDKNYAFHRCSLMKRRGRLLSFKAVGVCIDRCVITFFSKFRCCVAVVFVVATVGVVLLLLLSSSYLYWLYLAI